jgi:hypothetical protein
MAGPPGSPTSTLPSSTPPLLRLLPNIRRRIYRQLGLASWDGRPYQYNLRSGRASYAKRHVPEPGSFHGLLLSCRTIHAEAVSLLYSANHFVLYYHPDRNTPASLSPLGALTAPALQALSNLKIVFNEAACHHEGSWACCLQGRKDSGLGLYWCKLDHGGDVHQLPLLSEVSPGSHDDGLELAQAVLRDWQSAAAGLFSHVAPGHLALSLVCDIDPHHPQALDMANSIVAPISRLPQRHLKECHIRLAKTPDSRLKQLAQDTVSHVCGIATPSSMPPSKATTLATLPREIRTRILEYTDLVTPSREVIWSRQDRAYMVLLRARNPASTTAEHHSAKLFSCYQARTLAGEPPTSGCFCRRRHAAFSLTCNCWAPPGPGLFLVCRALYEDAQFVFFSMNRFILHDYKPCTPWALPLFEDCADNRVVPTYPYPHERFAACEFLREVVPPRALAYLRFLELVFPPYRRWPEKQHPAMQDWRATIDWLRDKISPPGLTLRLVVADLSEASPPAYLQRTLTMEEAAAIMEAYTELLQPLTRLAQDDGLARFYAHFTCPSELSEGTRARDQNEPGWAWREKADVKKRAERYVMGTRYESLYADGKKEPEGSGWDDIYY